MNQLIPHPRCSPPNGLAVEAHAQARAGGLWLAYSITGPLTKLVLPMRKSVRPGSDLWKSTCCEAFVGAPSGEYGEINLAPDGAFASYRFDAYRRLNPRDWGLPPPRIDITRNDEVWRLDAEIDLPAAGGLIGRVRIGLNAVVLAMDGTTSYWALAHVCEGPDFHHPDSLVMSLEIGP